jgi:hypothetical protein
VFYWTAWNEVDLELVPQHLARTVTEDVEWNDPRDSFVGINELEATIRELRESKPGYRFAITSEVDGHHDRFRYRWDMISRPESLIRIDFSGGRVLRTADSDQRPRKWRTGRVAS